MLGVHCGQFWDMVSVQKARQRPAARTERLGDPILEGDELEIQSSMTIVVPAWRITELLDWLANGRMDRHGGN